MATGILGAVEILAITNTTVYTVPADTFAVVTINAVNTTTVPKTVRLALATTGTPGIAEYIEYDVEVLGNGVVERTGIVLEAGRNVVAYVNSSGVSVQVYGIETSTI
tara:strand:- start:12677 stop:12997 length:321 start_codon:yes stop_codon:yes gene_type:complete